jgi:hypothetical protein
MGLAIRLIVSGKVDPAGCDPTDDRDFQIALLAGWPSYWNSRTGPTLTERTLAAVVAMLASFQAWLTLIERLSRLCVDHFVDLRVPLCHDVFSFRCSVFREGHDCIALGRVMHEDKTTGNGLVGIGN